MSALEDSEDFTTNAQQESLVDTLVTKCEALQSQVKELEAEHERHRWGLQWVLNNLAGIEHEWAREACAIARQALNPSPTTISTHIAGHAGARCPECE